MVPAVVSSCPERREQWGGGGRGNREGGSGVSRKGETKEPSADCHLRVTGSAPPLLPFFPLFLQLWASESALYAQMLGSSSPALRRSAGAPRTRDTQPVAGSRPWKGRSVVGEGRARGMRLLGEGAAGGELQCWGQRSRPLPGSCTRPALRVSTWVGSNNWETCERGPVTRSAPRPRGSRPGWAIDLGCGEGGKDAILISRFHHGLRPSFGAGGL